MAATALTGFAAATVIEAIFRVDLLPPPQMPGDLPDNQAFGVAGAVIGLGAVVIMGLLTASVSRPRLYFGWSMVGVVVVLTVLPFRWVEGIVPTAFTAALFLLVSMVAWATVSGVAIRSIRPGRTTRPVPPPPPPPPAQR
ncbi:hypothetical protein GCM10025865_23440 [Paraoerskovia sediminicola]|uniref:Uncharacterized protein n=1 Tax=Paraoerskovia sediminicola TaxID=1138587 RepID=A0ABN6XEC0_9CELL|nr:hypothetical protein [Paraoerskovia sediminicola]BDZ43045.1 hypothetical protein GCM10025865_23440 [Paraoerskovia sediminicola]